MYACDGQCTTSLEKHFSIVMVAFENGGFAAADTVLDVDRRPVTGSVRKNDAQGCAKVILSAL
jgi:hypothetical protein